MEPITFTRDLQPDEGRFIDTNISGRSRISNHIEILFDNPNDVGDNVTITFDASISKSESASGDAHHGVLLHLSNFLLPCTNQLKPMIDGKMHHFEISIERGTAEVSVDNKVVLPRYTYHPGAIGPASDWKRGSRPCSKSELSPPGVLIIGAHHSPSQAPRSVYARTAATICNVKIYHPKK